MLVTPPLSLYIHFPWCIRKCPYCDFNSHAVKGTIPEQEYIDILIADLESDLKKFELVRPLESIFMGGGTPSLFSARALEKLLSEINKLFKYAENIEITLEANPGTVEYQRFADYRAIGINRLSIGIQSFQAQQLKNLGRIHNDSEAIRAAETAHQAGFNNFNLDLMFGLPGQNISDTLFDLTTALELSPSHLSWYQLTIEPNTFFAHQPPVLPNDDDIWDMVLAGRDLLTSHGFKQYEISAYSLENKFCRHNKNYWEFGDYLGIGAGAHSKITDVNKQEIKRFWKLKNPKDYMNKYNLYDLKVLDNSELPFEFMLNALRLYQDIPAKLFSSRTGLDINILEKNLILAKNKNLLDWNLEIIQPTELGRRFYNDLVAMFM